MPEVIGALFVFLAVYVAFHVILTDPPKDPPPRRHHDHIP